MAQESGELHLRNILSWAGVALLLSVALYLIAWLLASADKIFSGTLANHNDFSVYVAVLRQGVEGKWLFHANGIIIYQILTTTSTMLES